MPLYLRDKNWRISYSSNENNPIADFYIPALECAIQYDRKSGFFSSAILSKVARGLGAMLHQQGRIRLIMGCQFSPEDLQAIQQGYELRDALLTRLDTDLKPPENFAQLKHFEILSWLIQNSYLDIKIAIPIHDNGFPIDSSPLTLKNQPLTPSQSYIFYEKFGIFTDTNGDQLAFSGSNNESLGGWERNIESFHVYCAWEEGRELERVQEEIIRFEQLWNNLDSNVQVFEVPEAVQKKLLNYAPTNKPTWDKQIEFDTRPLNINPAEISSLGVSEDVSGNISWGANVSFAININNAPINNVTINNINTHDEAHHARRKSPQNREETPNRLLELMQQLKEKTRSLILLSATPMQIDPIEVFDLLNLLGLQGHWSYGDNFCNYFASLTTSPDRHSLEFWQQMSTDYFQRGGEACSILQRYLEISDRLLAYRLRDIWQRGQKLVNPRQDLANDSFITTSRQYLTLNTPLKDIMFRHTRDTLRQYYQRGLLDRDIPRREVQDNAIALECDREIPLYVAVSDYVRHFYRLAQKQNRKALGFLMTLYRKRLTSSFYAIKESLQRRLDSLITGMGSSLTQDDFSDIDDAEDAVIEGLESYMEPVDPQEIQYLEDLLRQFETTGEDTKLSHFITILRRELSQRESAIVFTQYTDTMDFLRDTLLKLYGSQVACYSGRGGELFVNSQPLTNWSLVPKEEIKHRFREGEIKILLCTESASEGLNLQTCGVLINYDMPWNPMRVEQRIGRIDRIGQVYPTVRIHNFYYDGTVEAKVYRKLRDRINAFQTVVGNLQPILASVPTFIEQAAMSADPEEEGVLLAKFEHILDSPPLRPALDEMVTMDVAADLAEIRTSIPLSPILPEAIEQYLPLLHY